MPRSIRPETLLAALPASDNAVYLGRLYLREHPNEQHAEILIKLLLPHDDKKPPADSAALKKHLMRRQYEDFANGDTVIVDNWVLSRNEARLYALAALHIRISAFPPVISAEPSR
jgi:hypothetical protein